MSATLHRDHELLELTLLFLLVATVFSAGIAFVLAGSTIDVELVTLRYSSLVVGAFSVLTIGVVWRLGGLGRWGVCIAVVFSALLLVSTQALVLHSNDSYYAAQRAARDGESAAYEALARHALDTMEERARTTDLNAHGVTILPPRIHVDHRYELNLTLARISASRGDILGTLDHIQRASIAARSLGRFDDAAEVERVLAAYYERPEGRVWNKGQAWMNMPPWALESLVSDVAERQEDGHVDPAD